ncbi:MAG: flagellar protein FlgN [Lachnospiraceae bacterium]|nr:flagellar protein FlgN [Lachnospiraceae bacterium]
MASLIENLIDILENISTEYESLLGLSTKKTPVIVAGDLEKLALVTDEEQIVVSKINRLDQSFQVTMKDVANVINKDVNELTLMAIVDFLHSRPSEQQKLAAVYDRLSSVVHRVVKVNEQNSQLIRNALEMVEFDMNILQAMKASPETANYNRGAHSAGNSLGTGTKRFDARQ